MLGSQFLPVQWRGDCVGDNVDSHTACCFALQHFLTWFLSKRHRFVGCNITVLCPDWNLVKVIKNARQCDKRETVHDVQHQTQDLFDSTRKDVHPALCIEHLHSDGRAELPWTKWANKLASNENLGVQSEHANGNFPLDVNSIPSIIEVIQQNVPPPPAA